jgi:cell division protein FtsL
MRKTLKKLILSDRFTNIMIVLTILWAIGFLAVTIIAASHSHT